MPLLEQIGTLRLALARERGSITLNAPAQTVVPDPSRGCGYRIELEHRSPDEDWNAEISLLAGMAAAGMMVSRGLGLLRTMGASRRQILRSVVLEALLRLGARDCAVTIRDAPGVEACR